MPKGTPDHILKAYGSSTIVATCKHGQAFEKKKTGYCYNDIKDAIAALEQARAEERGRCAGIYKCSHCGHKETRGTQCGSF